MDGPRMDLGWTRERPWRDPGSTLEGPGIDPHWTMDGPGMDISHLYLTILYQKRSDSLSLELQAYFL